MVFEDPTRRRWHRALAALAAAAVVLGVAAFSSAASLIVTPRLPRVSEQLPARLRFALTEHTVTGLLLQRMPGESADPDAWNRCNQLFDTLGAAELQQWPAEMLLRRPAEPQRGEPHRLRLA